MTTAKTDPYDSWDEEETKKSKEDGDCDSWDEDTTHKKLEDNNENAPSLQENGWDEKPSRSKTTSDANDSWDEDTIEKKLPPACDKVSQIPQSPSTIKQSSENEGIKVKPMCSCDNCKYWMESADWTTTNSLNFECSSKKTHLNEHKIFPLMRTDENPGKTPRKIFTFNCDNLTKLEKQEIFKTFVHGEFVPQPINRVSNGYFNEDVQQALEQLNYKYSLPLQSFAWRALFRRMNLFLIGGPKSGKTMSYLPTVCTLCISEIENCKERNKYKGPLVVIICSNSKECEEIFDLTMKLFEHIRHQPKVAVITYPKPKVHSLNVDILITLPDSLIDCLKSKMFNLKRLCHLVIEDAYYILAYFQNSITEILSVANQMLQHRVTKNQLQLIVTSTRWGGHLEELYKSIYSTPLICFSNYLEAALYGYMPFVVKSLHPEEKKAYLKGILEDKYHLHKTIVFCKDSEIEDTFSYLNQQGIRAMYLVDDSSREEIERVEGDWFNAKGSQYKVLLCTDFIFETSLSLNDAIWMVHYSFPTTWTQFTRRFSALSLNLISPWLRDKEPVLYQTFLIIDDSCQQEIRKLVSLLTRLGQVPPFFKEKYEHDRIQKENNKIENDVKLCERLKLFGKCPDKFCDDRHLVRSEADINEDLPKTGKITFKILNMKNVTQYTVQLLSHTDLDGKTFEICDDDLKNPLKYETDFWETPATNIQIGKFYAHLEYTTEREVYTLCHVLSIEKGNIYVKLISGLTLQTFAKYLFEIPPHIKIVDIFLCNLVPPFGDQYFSGRSFKVSQNSLREKNYKNIILTGEIYLQLDQTFWLHNVVESVKVDGIDVIKFNLTKHLINLEVVTKTQSQISNLHKFCVKCGVTLPPYVKKGVKKPAKPSEVEPQRAFLDDNINEVHLLSAISPDEIYVCLAKFFPLLENLQKELQSMVKSEILDKHIDIVIGKHYLALERNGSQYSRAKVLNVEKDRALVFFVDYGDEAVVDIKTLKILPSKYITKLPFQAIQCRLFGLVPVLENWSDEETDILYNYVNEPDSDNLRSLYVEVRAKDEGDNVRAKTKYSVVLKDNFGNKETMINQLLVDCGLAKSRIKKFDDFEIPKPPVIEDSDSDLQSDIEEIQRENDDGGKEEHEEEAAEDKFLGFDLELRDGLEFLKMMGCQVTKEPTLPQITNSPTDQNCHPQDNNINNNNNNISSSNIESEDEAKLTPEVYWSQNDKIVKIMIKVANVTTYKANILRGKFFAFSTTVEEKNYSFKFVLHKPATILEHRALGQEVLVILSKKNAVEWLQLTATTKRLRYIHYDVPDVTEKKRRFLDLGISDDESDGENGPRPIIWDISDMDSEFDDEAVMTDSD